MPGHRAGVASGLGAGGDVLLVPAGDSDTDLIYTTNRIEGLNLAIRKVIKMRSLFPTEETIQKLGYFSIRNATDGCKWASGKWFSSKPQFAILFGE